MLFLTVLYSSLLSINGFLSSRCPFYQTHYGYLAEYPDKCYEFILNVQADWVTAQLDCRQKGGRLITIESSYEHNRIGEWLNKLNYHAKGIWIGLNDIQQEGTFVWDSGKPVTFTNWGYDQPDDYRYNQHQDCVMLYVPHHFEQDPVGHIHGIYSGSPGWHDQLCQDINGDREDEGWICEYDDFKNVPTTSIPPTPPTPLHLTVPNHQPVIPNIQTGCPSKYTRPSERTIIGNKCYEFILFDHRDWYTAHKDCHSKGGYLVTIESKQEETLLMHYIESTQYNGRGIWIGLHDQNQEGQFLWDSGRPVTYTNWEPGQPDDNDHAQPQDCALMYMPGPNSGKDSPGWHDQICIDLTPANTELDGWICEYYIGAPTTIAIPTPSMKPSTTTNAASTIMPTKTTMKHTTTARTPSSSTTSTPTTVSTTSTSTKATTTPTTTPIPKSTVTLSTTTSATTSTGVKTTTTPLPFIIGKRKIDVYFGH